MHFGMTWVSPLQIYSQYAEEENNAKEKKTTLENKSIRQPYCHSLNVTKCNWKIGKTDY